MPPDRGHSGNTYHQEYPAFSPVPKRLAGGSPLNYIPSMNFEWDEAKSDACFRERGFDFAYAARAFFILIA